MEAFIFFDIQGDWSVTQAEVTNMIKRLMMPLSKPDLESALQALFIASHGGGINSLEFVRRLKWHKDDVRKVKEVFDLYAVERRLFNDFKRWCDMTNPQAAAAASATGVGAGAGGGTHLLGTPASRRTSAVVEVDEDALRKSTAGGSRRATGQGSLSGTASRLNTGVSRPGTKAEPEAISRLNTGIDMPHFVQEADVDPEERDVVSGARLPFEGFEGFLRAIRLLKAGSSIEDLHLELARKAFDTMNWSEDKGNLISWVEFKHVLHVYLLNLPVWLQPILEKAESEVQRKRLELHEKVITFTDPIAQFSAMLATRFDNVFEAFVFFDMDGDWQVTNKEMHTMLPKLQLEMTKTDLDLTIGKIMRERNFKDEIFVDPKQFAKNLAWHPKPGTAPGLRRALDQAKDKRAEVVERALSFAKHGGASHSGLESVSILPEDEVVLSTVTRQISDMQALQRDFRRIKTFFGIPFDGRLAMAEEDIQRRREIARFDLQQRALQASDKGLGVLLDRARLRRSEIEAEAIKRSQDDVYTRKLKVEILKQSTSCQLYYMN